jgi:lysophospholipase L1-like esterase
MTPQSSPPRRHPRRPLAVRSAAGLAGLVALGALGHRTFLLQARVARRLIGKPLGEEAPSADRTYKKKYGDPIDLLVLGDSIAAGLGADLPEHTLGGQLATRLAKAARRSVRLHTGACVGAETSMVRAQLAALPVGYRADVAVIVVGGNDVIHRVRTSVSTRHLREVVEALHEQGVPVVVGTCPDLGALTAVPQPLRAVGRLASRQLAAAQRETATGLAAHAVSLADVVGPFFVAQPDQMFAVDRFHPSAAGYRRTAKALLPSVLAALGHDGRLPYGHHPPGRPVRCRVT